MLIRFLLLGSPPERNAVRQSILDAFEGRVGFRLEFDEHMRLSHAIESFDSCEQPKYVIATPSVLVEQAIELFRHIRGCGRSMLLVLWRYRPIDADSTAILEQHHVMTVTTDNPDFVMKKVVDALVGEQLRALRPDAAAARP